MQTFIKTITYGIIALENTVIYFIHEMFCLAEQPYLKVGKKDLRKSHCLKEMFKTHKRTAANQRSLSTYNGFILAADCS